MFILVWIISIFNYLAISMHFSLNTFKKIANTKAENGMAVCFGAFIFAISMIPKSIADINIFEGTIYKYVSIAFVFIVTMAILIFAYFKKKRSLRKGANIQ